jgi:hypothetical protein
MKKMRSELNKALESDLIRLDESERRKRFFLTVKVQ